MNQRPDTRDTTRRILLLTVFVFALFLFLPTPASTQDDEGAAGTRTPEPVSGSERERAGQKPVPPKIGPLQKGQPGGRRHETEGKPVKQKKKDIPVLPLPGGPSSFPGGPSVSPPVQPPPKVEPKKPPEPIKPAPRPTAEDYLKRATKKGILRIVVKNGRISGNVNDERFSLVGGGEIFYEDIRMSADRAEINKKDESALVKGRVIVTDDKNELNAESVLVKFNEKTLEAEGFVKFKKIVPGKEEPPAGASKAKRAQVILKNNPTSVYADELSYNWDTEELSARGTVKIIQDDLSLDCDELEYRKKEGIYLLKGNVFGTIARYEWIFKNDLVDKKDEKLARAIMKEPAQFEADSIEIDENKNIIKIISAQNKQVKVTQSDKRLEADSIIIDDQAKIITIEGSVKGWQRNGEWLIDGEVIKPDTRKEVREAALKEWNITCDKVVYDYGKKTTSVTGSIYASSEDYVGLADTLTYDDVAKLLVMEGNIYFERGLNEFFNASRIEILTNKKIYKIIGALQGRLRQKKEEKKEETKEETPAATTGRGT